MVRRYTIYPVLKETKEILEKQRKQLSKLIKINLSQADFMNLVAKNIKPTKLIKNDKKRK